MRSASHDPNSIARADQHTSANTTFPIARGTTEQTRPADFLPWRFSGAGLRSMSHRCHGAGIRKPSQKATFKPGFPVLVVAQFEVLSEGREKEFPVATGRTIDDGPTSPT
jgi:hypothetical protein